MRPVRRQRGWAFVIVLIALAIAAFLARDALMQFFASVTGSAATRVPAGAQPAADATQSTPLPRTPVERAQSVETTVQQGADDLRKRIDQQAR